MNKKKSSVEELIQKYINATGIMEKKMLEALIKRQKPNWKPGK